MKKVKQLGIWMNHSKVILTELNDIIYFYFHKLIL